jgi:hypothetical protein
MPVNTKNREYQDAEDRWSRCRDCYEGSDAVKEAGVKYLPELDSHKANPGGKAYEAYKQRALFFNATGRTVDGFAGAVFQKEPIVKLEPEPEEQLGPDGQPLELGPDGKPIEAPPPPEVDAEGHQVEEEIDPETGEPKIDPKTGETVKKKKLGPDGKPIAGETGPDGKPVVPELGPDGKPLPPKPKAKLGPDGKPLPEPKRGPDGKPLPEEELGPDGKPIPPKFKMKPKAKLGPDGKPLFKQQMGPDGKPVSKPKLGPDGKPLSKLGPDGKPVLKLGPDGKPIPKLDDKGQPILDPEGKPVFETESETETQQELGPDGKPVAEQELDENGQPVEEQELDENGQPIEEPKLGPDGKPVPPKLGIDGKPILPKAVEPPANPVLKHVDDITLTGTSLDLFAYESMQEVLITGRYGILVDMADTEIRDKQRPYWAGYDAESIVNWTTDRIDGEEKLIRVVLCENSEEEDPLDQFAVVEEERYRVLSIEDGVYIQRVWAKGKLVRDAEALAQSKNAQAKGQPGSQTGSVTKGVTPSSLPYSLAEQQKMYNGEPLARPEPPIQFAGRSGDDWGIVEELNPVRRGKPLDFIPFYFVNSTGASAGISKPPLLDLIDLNLSHYRTMADLEHGRHFSGLPTPWISGAAVNESNEVQLGPSGVLILEKGGSAGVLQSSTSFPSLELADQEKRKMMSVLGARLLEEQAVANETMGAVSMRHSGEQAVLRTIVQVLEQQLTRAMRAHVWWMQTEKDPSDLDYVRIELNKEFFAARMQPPELAALLAALQADGISYKTFYYNLAVGGITRPGVSDEDEQTEIANKPETPVGSMPNADPGALNSMIYNDPNGNPMPTPNPMPGLPGRPVNPPGVTPPALAPHANAAKAAAKSAKGSPFGSTKKGRTIQVDRDANGRASAYRIQ